MAEGENPGGGAGRARFLTFRARSQLYALPAEEVAEVIRLPQVARVPHSPRGLLGLANLRGQVLPVASLRGLLGGDEGESVRDARAIVLHGAAPAAVAVDAIEALADVAEAGLETRPDRVPAAGGEKLRGAFRTGRSGEVAKVLDIAALLQGAFTARPRERGTAGSAAGLPARVEAAEAAHLLRLVSFDVAGQEFALELSEVREVTPAPTSMAAAPHAEAVLLGIAPYRDELLPLMSLRALLGFPPAAPDGAEKVVVAKVGGGLVGLVADRMRAIVSAEPERIEPTPAMLAARAGGESRIKAIYRGEGGRRLISILDPDQLFREDVMARLDTGAEARPTAQAPDSVADDELQLLVFRLGDGEFGLPIGAVSEVARVPDKISRVPKTPKFLEGVVNLRGEVLPVIDQRRRFDMPGFAGQGRRLVVVRADGRPAGLIVDSVSDVLRVGKHAVEEAPELAGEAKRLVAGVVNLERDGRMVLVLDPSELLTRAERSLLESFSAGQARDGA